MRLLFLAGLLALPEIAVAQGIGQGIGAVEEVRSQAFATPPAAQRSRVETARRVVSNEVIETVSDGAVGLRFNDNTQFRVGPDSQVILDRFVYNPNVRNGEMALQLSRGAFRFISGTMPKERIAVRTPTALIGVRGTDFLVRVNADGSTRVSVFEGQVTIQPLVGVPTFLLVSPGQAAETDSTGNTAMAQPLPGETGNGFMGSDELNNGIAGPSQMGPGSGPPVVVPPIPPPVIPIIPPPPPPPYIPQKTPYCLAGDSMILTADGMRRIDSLQPGDSIASLGEEGGLIWRKLDKLSKHGAEEVRASDVPLVALHLVDGQSLTLTANHWLLAGDGWKQAGDLQGGDWLRGQSGGLVRLERIERDLPVQAVYNLEFESFPNYMAAGLVVAGGVLETDTKK